MKTQYFSHGKLLLTGEYLVLDGALALAVPTKFGQWLEVAPIENPKISWRSLDENGTVWFQDEFKIGDVISPKNSDNEVSKRLTEILNAVKSLNPNALSQHKGYKVVASLDFPQNWGLGSSSTLINNIAQWTQVDAYQLLENTFGGSGYDIACAQNNSALTYCKQNGVPSVNLVNFNPPFKAHLYFVHLNKKQNSREGIKHYHKNKSNSGEFVSDINRITQKVIAATTLEHFNELIDLHETIIGKITKQTPVKNLLFEDFIGSIKSLGAWGGDFILASSKTNPTAYFKNKGFNTVIPYDKMIG